MGECGDAFFAIQFPFAVERRIVLRGRNVGRRNRSAVDATTLPGRVAVHSDAIQLDYKRIAGQRPFHIEWSRLKVATRRASLHVASARVVGPRSDRIAGKDAQRRGIRG